MEVHLMECDYGCGNQATFIFKNGKRCCAKRCNLCPAQITKTKLTQHTPDPITGLTPLERRQITLRETIDSSTGLSSMELKNLKFQKSLMTVDQTTGITPRDKAKRTLQQIDPVTGKTKKQLATEKALQTLSQIDPNTGLTLIQVRTKKTQAKQREFEQEKRIKINQKRNNTLDQIDPKTGLTRRQLRGLSISKQKRLIDPCSGLSQAQLVAIKNKTN